MMVAGCPAAVAILSQDTSYKYLPPKVVFLSILVLVVVNAMAGALLHFRGQQYSKFLKEESEGPTVTVSESVTTTKANTPTQPTVTVKAS